MFVAKATHSLDILGNYFPNKARKIYGHGKPNAEARAFP